MNTSTYRPGGRMPVTHLGPSAGVAVADAAGAAQPDRTELIAEVARFLQRRPRRPDSLRNALAADAALARGMWPINGESSAAGRLRSVADESSRPVAW